MHRSIASLVFLALGAIAFAQQTVPPDGFFSDVVVANPAPMNFTPAPVLDNTPAANVSSVLTASQAAGLPLAVRVRQSLDDPAALGVFNNFPAQYVFTDFIGVGAAERAGEVADQVVNSTQSQNAFVGNFGFYPNASIDPTRSVSAPANPSSNYTTARGEFGFARQIAAPALRPGTPDYRNPAAGNSGAPNIRSALFTLPIQRLTLAELGLQGFTSIPAGTFAYALGGDPANPDHRLIPWVARFNNFGNAALDSDGNTSNGYAFVQNAATPSNGQLPSRGDFQAQILHYRLRGADSVNLNSVNSGGSGNVVGYSVAQEQSDVRTGWAASSVANAIFARGNYRFANITNTIGDSGGESGDVDPRNTELAGAVWSGVYDRVGTVDPASSARRLVILLSNLSSVQKIVDFPNNIDGSTVFGSPNDVDDPDNFTIQPGQHRLIEFALETSSRGQIEWVFQQDSFIGLDNNRNGIGIGSAFPAEEIGITDPAEVCPESVGNAASVADAGANATYYWHVENGTVQTGQGTSAITFAAAEGPSLTLSVTVVKSNGGVLQGAEVIPVGPPTTITAPAFAVPGSTDNQASAPAGTGLTYRWTIDGDGAEITSSPTARTITFSVGGEDVTLLLTVMNTMGCRGSSSKIIQINQTPGPADDIVFLAGNQPRDIFVLGNDGDPDNDDLMVTGVSQPQFGTVEIINGGTAIRYTPNGNVRADSFTYVISDGRGGISLATVTIGDFSTAAAGVLNGLVQATAGPTPSNESAGLLQVKIGKLGVFSGKLQLAGRKFSLRGYFDVAGVAHFLKPALTALPLVRTKPDLANLELRLALSDDLQTLTGTLTESGADFAVVSAARPLVASKTSPPLPAGLAGAYTVIFPAAPAPNNGLDASQYPQGTGVGVLTVSAKGVAKMKGVLADGTAISYANAIATTLEWPFYVPLAKGKGSISGPVTFRETAFVSDLDGLGLNWFKPAGAGPLYPNGWPNGITIDLLGSTFQKPADQSVFFGLAAEDADGNAEASLTGDNPPIAITKAVNISTKNKIAVLPQNEDEKLTLSLKPTGLISGSFLKPGEQVKRGITGVVFQKQERAAGFFLGTSESGTFTLTPK